MIHSFSAADPDDPDTIAGRWLAQGAFLYSRVDERALPPRVPPPVLVAELLATGVPFAAAERPLADEPFGHPWRLVVLGDPLYTLVRADGSRRRSHDFPATSAWTPYAASPPPAPDAPETVRLGWALNAALIQTTAGAADASAGILAVLRSIDRARLPEAFRPVFDDLTAVMLYEGRRLDALRAFVSAIPRHRSDAGRRRGSRSRPPWPSSRRPSPGATSTGPRRSGRSWSGRASTPSSSACSSAGSPRWPTPRRAATSGATGSARLSPRPRAPRRGGDHRRAQRLDDADKARPALTGLATEAPETEAQGRQRRRCSSLPCALCLLPSTLRLRSASPLRPQLRQVQRRPVRPHEGRDDLGQGPEMEVDQAADGVVVEREVPLPRQRPVAVPAVAVDVDRRQVPPARAIAADAACPASASQLSRASVRSSGAGGVHSGRSVESIGRMPTPATQRSGRIIDRPRYAVPPPSE